jgi:hypothetical protein
MNTKRKPQSNAPHFSPEVRALLQGINKLPVEKRDFLIGDMLRHGSPGQRRMVASYVQAVLES